MSDDLCPRCGFNLSRRHLDPMRRLLNAVVDRAYENQQWDVGKDENRNRFKYRLYVMGGYSRETTVPEPEGGWTGESAKGAYLAARAASDCEDRIFPVARISDDGKMLYLRYRVARSTANGKICKGDLHGLVTSVIDDITTKVCPNWTVPDLFSGLPPELAKIGFEQANKIPKHRGAHIA